jgi:hypothetical protein
MSAGISSPSAAGACMVMALSWLSALLCSRGCPRGSIWPRSGNSPPRIVRLDGDRVRDHSVNVPLSIWRWWLLIAAQELDVPFRQLSASMLVALFFNNFAEQHRATSSVSATPRKRPVRRRSPRRSSWSIGRWG